MPSVPEILIINERLDFLYGLYVCHIPTNGNIHPKGILCPELNQPASAPLGPTYVTLPAVFPPSEARLILPNPVLDLFPFPPFR